MPCTACTSCTGCAHCAKGGGKDLVHPSPKVRERFLKVLWEAFAFVAPLLADEHRPIRGLAADCLKACANRAEKSLAPVCPYFTYESSQRDEQRGAEDLTVRSARPLGVRAAVVAIASAAPSVGGKELAGGWGSPLDSYNVSSGLVLANRPLQHPVAITRGWTGPPRAGHPFGRPRPERVDSENGSRSSTRTAAAHAMLT